MKLKNEYLTPQITVVGLSADDIMTQSFDLTDTWKDDIFGTNGLNLLNRS